MKKFFEKPIFDPNNQIWFKILKIGIYFSILGSFVLSIILLYPFTLVEVEMFGLRNGSYQFWYELQPNVFLILLLIVFSSLITILYTAISMALLGFLINVDQIKAKIVNEKK